jgi:hypothetical protein
MSKISVREDKPEPSPGGWEAYRAVALAVIQQQERALKDDTLPTGKMRDANRDH